MDRSYLSTLRGRLTVGHQVLVLSIGVRIPTPQQLDLSIENDRGVS